MKRLSIHARMSRRGEVGPPYMADLEGQNQIPVTLLKLKMSLIAAISGHNKL
jgi:hypothetical protein